MIHSQTKLKYPNCPFVTLIDDFNKQIQHIFDSEDIVQSTMIDLIRESIDPVTSERYGNDYPMIIENFLVGETDSNIYSKILYRVSRQKIKRSTNLMINFITTAYRDDNDPLINREYSTTISWTVLPLSIDVVADRLGYSIDLIPTTLSTPPSTSISTPKILNTIDVVQNLNPVTHTVNTEMQKIESNIMMIRTGRRGTVARDLEIKAEVKEKKDVYSYPDIQTTSRLEFKPAFSQIPLDNNTRASAQMIRSRLGNPHKAYRLRNNPEAYKRSLKIDPSIQNVGTTLINDHNDKYNLFRTDVPKALFDYVNENIEIKKLSGILRFSPWNSGRILIENISTNNMKFLSILRHNAFLHITLHDVDLS